MGVCCVHLVLDAEYVLFSCLLVSYVFFYAPKKAFLFNYCIICAAPSSSDISWNHR